MRTCVTCGNSMSEGYLLEELGDTFCSSKCLDEVFPGSSVEMENMTEEELANSTWYWTTWEEDSDEVKAQYRAMGIEIDEDQEGQVSNKEHFKAIMHMIGMKE